MDKVEHPIKLTIELVPSTSWYSNVRSEVSKSEWDFIRKKVYRNANYHCEICYGVGKKWPVECHEIWVYDDEKHIQELGGMQALCPNCHMVKHIGRTVEIGKGLQAISHLCKVNFWSKEKATEYMQESFAIWNERSQHEWRLNLFYLKTLTKGKV